MAAFVRANATQPMCAACVREIERSGAAAGRIGRRLPPGPCARCGRNVIARFAHPVAA